MEIDLFDQLIGFVTLIVWLFILRRGSTISSWMISPHSLFSIGILTLYIVPCIYWGMRDWTYGIPDYSSGIPRVQWISLWMGIPLLIDRIFVWKVGRDENIVTPATPHSVRWAAWAVITFFALAIFGFVWKIYLISLGHQSRFERVEPTVFGSVELGFLLGNIGFYYRTFYFLVILIGNKRMVRFAKYAWIFDGFLQLFSLHRYALIMFLFHSSVFLALRGFVFSIRGFLLLGVGLLFTLTIVGYASVTAYDYVSSSSYYLGPLDVLSALWSSFTTYTEGTFEATRTNSTSDWALIRMIDDTMFRLHEGRSAAAVVPYFPSVFPFLNGETILQIFYALIPRYFWPSKPDLRDAHVMTVEFMPGDVGINPLGTLAEVYINGGYALVAAIAIVCVFLFHWLLGRLRTTNIRRKMAMLALYPLIAELLVSANRNFSQRASEGLRIMLVYFFIVLILKLASVPGQSYLTPPTSRESL